MDGASAPTLASHGSSLDPRLLCEISWQAQPGVLQPWRPGTVGLPMCGLAPLRELVLLTMTKVQAISPASRPACTPSPLSGQGLIALWGKSGLARLPQEAFGKRITNTCILAASPESCSFTHALWLPPRVPAGFLQQFYWKLGASLSVSLEKNLLNHPASRRANQKPQNLEKAERGRKANGPHGSVDLFLPLCCSFLSGSMKRSVSLQLVRRIAFPPICILWSTQT